MDESGNGEKVYWLIFLVVVITIFIILFALISRVSSYFIDSSGSFNNLYKFIIVILIDIVIIGAIMWYCTKPTFDLGHKIQSCLF